MSEERRQRRLERSPEQAAAMERAAPARQLKAVADRLTHALLKDDDAEVRQCVGLAADIMGTELVARGETGDGNSMKSIGQRILSEQQGRGGGRGRD